MRLFEVELRFPSHADLFACPWPPSAVIGVYTGSLIQQSTGGSFAPVAVMAAASVAATFLALSGRHGCGGWKGLALMLGRAGATFEVVTLSTLMLDG
jgi:hypothetical protein